MRHSTLMAAATAASLAHAAPTAAPTSLTEMCTVSNVQAALPKNGTLEGIFLIPSSVTAQAVYNSSSSTSFFKKRQVAGGGSSTTTGIYNYCNVTATYTHGNDSVVVWYGFPEPSQFENRFYVGGGAGYALSSAGVTPGLEYGAVTGCTDAGYDAFENSLDAVVLNDDDSINWQNVKMFSYQALGEMTQIGKHLTTQLYGIKKVYTYFYGCSDGGRQGQSQVQHYGDVYDGIITGAPAFRQGQQQTLHVYPAVVEQTQDYYPTTCAIDKIVNATIAACDPLDGRTDGVLSRTDLCMLNFNLSSIVGESYYCAAVNSTSLGYNFGKRDVNTGATSSYTPAQNGTVNAKDVAVVQQIYDGVFNSKGQRAYLSWQIGANPADADTTYNSTTGKYTYDIPSTGGVFITKFLEQVNLDNLANIDGVTYDTIVGWMKEGMNKYLTTLQTTNPDISTFRNSGAKLLHYHGESDNSVPTASSVHYYDSVRSFLYPNMTYNASVAALNDWYRLFLIPGAAHCSSNTLQPNGPFPTDFVATMIDWVEGDSNPVRLNATVTEGPYEGEIQKLCSWPLRPLWTSDESFDCVYDQASIDTWTYTFDAYDEVVY